MTVEAPMIHEYQYVKHGDKKKDKKAIDSIYYVIDRYNEVIKRLCKQLNGKKLDKNAWEKTNYDLAYMVKMRDRLIQDFGLEDEFAIDCGRG